MFPALYHNNSQRPRMSLLMPALVNLNNETNKNKQQSSGGNSIAFMQIDCEILDTTLFNLNPNEIPTDYVKILVDDYDQQVKPTTTTDIPVTKSITPTSTIKS